MLKLVFFYWKAEFVRNATDISFGKDLLLNTKHMIVPQFYEKMCFFFAFLNTFSQKWKLVQKNPPKNYWRLFVNFGFTQKSLKTPFMKIMNF